VIVCAVSRWRFLPDKGTVSKCWEWQADRFPKAAALFQLRHGLVGSRGEKIALERQPIRNLGNRYVKASLHADHQIAGTSRWATPKRKMIDCLRLHRANETPTSAKRPIIRPPDSRSGMGGVDLRSIDDVLVRSFYNSGRCGPSRLSNIAHIRRMDQRS
jgi:hypothetical protein